MHHIHMYIHVNINHRNVVSHQQDMILNPRWYHFRYTQKCNKYVLYFKFAHILYTYIVYIYCTHILHNCILYTYTVYVYCIHNCIHILYTLHLLYTYIVYIYSWNNTWIYMDHILMMIVSHCISWYPRNRTVRDLHTCLSVQTADERESGKISNNCSLPHFFNK